MRAIAITEGGAPVAPNVAVLDGIAIPEPGRGELRVKTEAAALNHLDLWVGQGIPGVDRPYPRITGSDGVGIVEAIGPEVDPEWIGARVILNAAIAAPQEGRPGRAPAGEAFHLIGEQVPGCLGEFFVAPAANVLSIGDRDPVQAAAFGLTHLTAWRMLVTRAGLGPGQWVLIPGIGGGVALASLAIARFLGASTIVTSRSPEKLKQALALGADHAILDTGEDFSREVKALTAGRGIDVCAESVGAAIHDSCLKSLARAGTLVTCGATSGGVATTDLARIFWHQLSIQGSTMGDMAEFRAVVALFMAGSLCPVVDQVYPVNEAPRGFERLEAGEQFGKLVIDWRRG